MGRFRPARRMCPQSRRPPLRSRISPHGSRAARRDLAAAADRSGRRLMRSCSRRRRWGGAFGARARACTGLISMSAAAGPGGSRRPASCGSRARIRSRSSAPGASTRGRRTPRPRGGRSCVGGASRRLGRAHEGDRLVGLHGPVPSAGPARRGLDLGGGGPSGRPLLADQRPHLRGGPRMWADGALRSVRPQLEGLATGLVAADLALQLR